MRTMSFVQAPPELGNQYRDDRVLSSYLRRVLPPAARAAIEPELVALGEHAAHAWKRKLASPREEPRLTQWDAWGERVDHIELTRVWREGPAFAARHGLVAAGHDAFHGV